MPLGVYRISTSRQSGYQAVIRAYFPDSKFYPTSHSHNGAIRQSKLAAIEWCYVTRQILSLPASHNVSRNSKDTGWTAAVTKWFKTERAAVRWRKKAVRILEEGEYL